MPAGATAVTPYQAALAAAWQLLQLRLATAACPAAESDGALEILNPPTAMLVA